MVQLQRGDIILAYDVTEGMEFPSREWCRLESPALLLHERPHPGMLGFTLTPWMPTELMANSIIQLSREQIVGYLVPSPELLNYYKTWVDIEQDRWKSFGKEFVQQIVEIEKNSRTRYEEAKRRRTSVMSLESDSNELLFNMFDEDINWGNSKTTH